MSGPNPFAPLAEFDEGRWHIRVRQYVSGALFWTARRLDARDDVERSSGPMPAGFTIEDTRRDAIRAIGSQL